MDNKNVTIITVLLVLVFVGLGYYAWQRDSVPASPVTPTSTGGNTSPTTTLDDPETVTNTMIRVSLPVANQMVTNSVRVTGEARGNWYFEASFPMKIVDSNGNQLGVGYAQAQGEWMTENFVPFVGIINFTTSSSETGELILEKDNPSGLPEYDREVRIPIRFNPQHVSSQTVQLYYYDESKDKDSSGNIKCSRDGLQSVERIIPRTITPIQDTIKLLLGGELTPAERNRGLETEFPLDGVNLKSASLANGTLTLTFDDPENKTGGGSCRVGVLWNQIEATAKQFAGVTQVQFMPEELFQP